MKKATIFKGRNYLNTQVIFIALGAKKRYENPSQYPDTFKVIEISDLSKQYDGISIEDLTKEPQQVRRNEKGWFIC